MVLDAASEISRVSSQSLAASEAQLQYANSSATCYSMFRLVIINASCQFLSMPRKEWPRNESTPVKDANIGFCLRANLCNDTEF